VRGGGVSLLDWQVPVIPRTIQPLRVSATACEVFLVYTVSEGVWNSADNGSPHFAGRHLSQLDRCGLTVERGVWRHN